MHSVKEIWEAEEPQDRSLKTRILVKSSGEPYSLSLFGTPAYDMKGWEKIATIPPLLHNVSARKSSFLGTSATRRNREPY